MLRRDDQLANILAGLNALSARRAALTQYLFGSLAKQIKEASGRSTSRPFADDSLERYLFSSLKDIVNITERIVSAYTGYQCAVSVKILKDDRPDEPATTGRLPYVMTFIRDDKSASERSNIDRTLPRYAYYKHTAFYDVVVSEDDMPFYHSNNLRELADRGRYHNGNARWREYYNATSVVPIREPHMGGKEAIIGFLCVDNRFGGFDEPVCRPLLHIISNVLYDIFRMSAFIKGLAFLPRTATPERVEGI